MTAEGAGIIGSRTDATARAVIECAADAIVAFSTDRTVMLWNPAAERMFGWAAAEVVGLEPQIIAKVTRRGRTDESLHLRTPEQGP